MGNGGRSVHVSSVRCSKTDCQTNAEHVCRTEEQTPRAGETMQSSERLGCCPDNLAGLEPAGIGSPYGALVSVIILRDIPYFGRQGRKKYPVCHSPPRDMPLRSMIKASDIIQADPDVALEYSIFLLSNGL